jgi:hypothetical protein
MTWKIQNLEKYAKANPATFFLQPKEDRANLRRGDFARLFFSDADSGGVQVWVEIEEAKSSGKYVGVIAEKVALDPLAFGDRVSFGPEHVGETRGPEDLPHPAPWNYTLGGVFDIWRPESPAPEVVISEDDFWYDWAPEAVKARSKGRRPSGQAQAPVDRGQGYQPPRPYPPRAYPPRQSLEDWDPRAYGPRT